MYAHFAYGDAIAIAVQYRYRADELRQHAERATGLGYEDVAADFASRADADETKLEAACEFIAQVFGTSKIVATSDVEELASTGFPEPPLSDFPNWF